MNSLSQYKTKHSNKPYEYEGNQVKKVDDIKMYVNNLIKYYITIYKIYICQ